MAFYLKKTYELAEYGWEGCSVTFQALTYGEIKSLQEKLKDKEAASKEQEDELVQYLAARVIEGEGLDEKGQKVKITKENFQELPFQIVIDICYKISGGDISPN